MIDNQVEYIIQFQDRASARFDPIIRKVQTLQQRVDATTARMTQRFDATGHAIARVPGKIETLRDKLERLRIKSEQAFDEKHIGRYNRMIRQTETELSRLNRLDMPMTGKGGKGILGMLSGAGGMMGRLMPAMIVATAMIKIVSGIKSVAQTAAKYEQLKTGFEVLLGSKGKADMMVGELVNYASRSPLRNEDIFPATQTLLSFGVSAEKILPTIKMLGDVSMGNSEKFSGLSLAFAQTQATGRLMGQDLLQMVNQGFNPLQEMSRMTGKSMRDLKEDMEKGKISADMVTEAFEHATAQGGRFYGMADKMGKTLGGRWSTIQDNIEKIQKLVGERLYGTFSKVLTVASGFIEKLTEWFDLPVATKIENERIELNKLALSIMDANDDQEERNRLIDELKAKYPDLLGDIDNETVSNDYLAKAMERVNNQYIVKIRNAQNEKTLLKLAELQADALDRQVNARDKFNESLAKSMPLFWQSNSLAARQIEDAATIEDKMALIENHFNGIGGTGVEVLKLRHEYLEATTNVRSVNQKSQNESLRLAEQAINDALNITNTVDNVADKILEVAVKSSDKTISGIARAELLDRKKRQPKSKVIPDLDPNPNHDKEKDVLIIRPGTERANVAEEGQVREALKPAMEISRLESRGYAKLFNLRDQVAEKVYQNKIGRIEPIQLEKILSTMNSVAARSIPEHPNAINPSGSFDPEAGRAIMTGSGTRDIHIHMGKFMEQVVINNSNSAKEGATESVEKTKEAFLNLLKSINSLSVRQ